MVGDEVAEMDHFDIEKGVQQNPLMAELMVSPFKTI